MDHGGPRRVDHVTLRRIIIIEDGRTDLKPQNFRRPSTFDLSLRFSLATIICRPNLRQPSTHALSWAEKLTDLSSCRLGML